MRGWPRLEHRHVCKIVIVCVRAEDLDHFLFLFPGFCHSLCEVNLQLVGIVNGWQETGFFLHFPIYELRNLRTIPLRFLRFLVCLFELCHF